MGVDFRDKREGQRGLETVGRCWVRLLCFQVLYQSKTNPHHQYLFHRQGEDSQR